MAVYNAQYATIEDVYNNTCHKLKTMAEGITDASRPTVEEFVNHVCDMASDLRCAYAGYTHQFDLGARGRKFNSVALVHNVEDVYTDLFNSELTDLINGDITIYDLMECTYAILASCEIYPNAIDAVYTPTAIASLNVLISEIKQRVGWQEINNVYELYNI